MNNWIKSAWFERLVSAIREAIGEAQALAEGPACRIQVEMALKDAGFNPPANMSAKELVADIARHMTRCRILGEDLGQFSGICHYLPPMRRIDDALRDQELHARVRLPPTPPVLTDGRIDSKEFWNVLEKQAFTIKPD
jgi:hypothetical protein